MGKKIIVTETQLRGYVERKKAEKVFCSILESLYKNSKFLGEGISLNNANQTIIENYKRKKLISSEVEKLLQEYNIINHKGQII